MFSRLLGNDRPQERGPGATPPARLVLLGKSGWPEDVEVVGETYHQEAIKALFNAVGDDSGGVLNRTGVLRAEPDNPYDRNAVAVVIDDMVVGHVPATIAPVIQPLVLQAARRNEIVGVPARVWARNDGVSWGARVTLSADHREGEWTYAQQETERRAAREAAEHGVDVETARANLEESARVSTVRGKHYSEWTATVENWKRAERYDEALALLDDCQLAAAADARLWRRPPAPWYYEQAAIVHRKRKDYAAEIAVLESYMAATRDADCSRDTAALERIESRLFKARKLAGQA